MNNQSAGRGRLTQEETLKTKGAFSTSHSMVSALPAMSLNSAPGFDERINVATGHPKQKEENMRRMSLTSEDHSEVARVHKVPFRTLEHPADRLARMRRGN